jgi:uncharacterized BrkB/YihY/UPF0761 family membrane protein
MAFFAVTSLAPILLIVVAIAGLVFGREAAQSALDDQMRGVMGNQRLRSGVPSSLRNIGSIRRL